MVETYKYDAVQNHNHRHMRRSSEGDKEIKIFITGGLSHGQVNAISEIGHKSWQEVLRKAMQTRSLRKGTH